MNKKKTYKLQLPKDVNVDKANLRIHDGQIVVDVEFKDKSVPKDGDFLSTKDGRVFIYNNKNTLFQYGAYCGLDIYNNIIISDCKLPGWTGKEGCRYATPEEKYAFLERLEKEYKKKWNPDKKELEDIRWIADKDCTYYYVDERGNVLGCNDTRGCASDSRYSCGNYFKTREAARPYSDQIKEIFKKSKAE